MLSMRTMTFLPRFKTGGSSDEGQLQFDLEHPGALPHCDNMASTNGIKDSR